MNTKSLDDFACLNKDELVALASSAVAKLLVGNRENVTACKIQIKQFGTNLLYLPVYLLLADIERYWNDNWKNCSLEIEYINCKTDKNSCEQVRNPPAPDPAPWSYEQPSILTIGLSELPNKLRDGQWFIEFPFIKRLPLWGIALTNNRKVNSLKTVSQARSSELRPGVDEWRSVKLSYWNTFGGKMSLLNGMDFVDADLQLAVSLYESGTTAHRLFYDDFLKRFDKSALQIKEVTFKDEFDALFAGTVDVALTVQPWQAVRKAVKIGREVETVYVHQGRPEPFSSFYCCAPNDPYDRDLLEIAFKSIHLGVQEKIALLYELDDAQSKSCLEVLMKIEDQANKSAGEDSDARTDIGDFSANDMNCALHLVSDSRIYYYDTVNMSETSSRDYQILLEGNLKYCAERRDGFRGLGDGADPISTVTRLVATLPDVHTHNASTLREVAARNDSHARTIKDLMAVYEKHKSHMEKISYDTTCQVLCNQWRCVKVEQLLPRLVEASKQYESSNVRNKITADDFWRDDDDDYTFWFDLLILRKALNHFDSLLVADGSRVVDCCAGVLKAGVAGIAWVWITYNTKEVKKEPSKWHFSQDDIAKRLLHGWFVSRTYKAEEHPQPWPIFNRNHRADATRLKDNVELTFADDKTTLSMGDADHGFLFTFDVVRKGGRDYGM